MKKIFLITIAIAAILNAAASNNFYAKDFQGPSNIMMKSTNFTKMNSDGTSFDDASCPVGATLADLSGEIEIEWEYSTLKETADYITGADIRYTGPENVTITVSVDGNVIGTSNENSFFQQFYDENGTFFLKGDHTMLVTASMTGYNDVNKTEEFAQADWSGKININIDDEDCYIYIDYNGYENVTMTVMENGWLEAEKHGIHPRYSFYFGSGGEEIKHTLNYSDDDYFTLDVTVCAEGHEELSETKEYIPHNPYTPAPEIYSYVYNNDIVYIGMDYESGYGSFSVDDEQIYEFHTYGDYGNNYCYVMRGDEDFTVHASAWAKTLGDYEVGYAEEDILIPARDNSGNIPATDPHGTGSWIVLKDKNGADVWYPLGNTIPVKKSVFGNGEVAFRFVYEGTQYGKKVIYDAYSDYEEETPYDALFETGEDFTLPAGYNYTIDIAHSSDLYAYGFGYESDPIYLLGEKMLANITQLDSIPDEPEPEFIRGDVNGDGIVDVSDVADLVDNLLTGRPLDGNGDVNRDDIVDVSDIADLLDYLLKGTWPDEPEPAGETFTVNGVSFKMMPVEGGTFSMGATPEQGDDTRDNEKPVHQVTLSGYNIGQTEVTQALWQAVMGSNPSNHTGNMQNPVESINWSDCQTFIQRLNELTGKNFRLPTEAEWEFAARGGNKTQGYTYSGSDDLDEVAWYSGNSGSESHPVATKKANELGIYDMNGNIEEWCNDWYSLYTEDAVTNPTSPENGTSRIHRGGRYSGGTKFCRITRRDGFAPTATRNYMGLRLAK